MFQTPRGQRLKACGTPVSFPKWVSIAQSHLLYCAGCGAGQAESSHLWAGDRGGACCEWQRATWRRTAIQQQPTQQHQVCHTSLHAVQCSATAGPFPAEFCATFCRENSNVGLPEGGSSSSYKVEPEKVAELYREWVMPLTKEVQIQYLLRRLDGSQRWQGR